MKESIQTHWLRGSIMKFCKGRKNIFHLSYLFCVLTMHFFTHADIPYVQGVDYFPQHYNGYYNGENKNFAISDSDIEKDMDAISQNFDAIRTYEYDPINLQRILRTAKRYQIKVALGLNINPNDPEYTDFQLKGLDVMFAQYPDLIDSVITVVMGNYVIDSGNGSKISQNIDFLSKQIKKISEFNWLKNAKLPIPLSISENANILLNSQIANELLEKLPKKTIIFANINPYMAGCTLSGAIRQDNSCKNNSFPDVWEKLINTKLSAKYQFVIGAVGWPTEGMKLNTPKQTNIGSTNDAIEYYNFLYSSYLNKPFTINGHKKAIPFFIFSAFDQPMNGAFGFASNFWGVYNADSTPKFGMVYPLNRTITPEPKLGTAIKINLINEYYANAKTPVFFNIKKRTYSNKIVINSQEKNQIFSFIDEYPFVEYSVNGSNEVKIILPKTNNPNYSDAECINYLLSGSLYDNNTPLEWESAFSKDAEKNGCKYVNWAGNGIFIIG